MINGIFKGLTALVLVTVMTCVLEAQHKSFSQQDGLYRFTTEEGTYKLRFFSPEILEVAFIAEGESADDVQGSHAVVLEPGSPRVVVDEHEDLIVLNTSGIKVRYDLPRTAFSFYYEDRKLLSEHHGFTLNPSEDEEGNPTHDEGFRVDFRISESEALMGGGSRALGMNRRGNRLELYNRAHYGYENRSDLINFTLPVVMSSEKYLLHFDNPTTGWLDLDSGNDHTIAFEGHSGRKVYQLVAGDSWERVIQNYTSLTGLQPLPPRWALGNFSSRFGYRTQEEVLETIARFRELNVPVDAVIIDLYWFGDEIQGTMGNLAFYEPNWPDPKQMVQELEEQGVKTVLITEPFVLTTSDRWDEVVEAGVMAQDTLGNPATWDFYFGNTGLIDVFKPEAMDWFWGIYEEKMTKYGVHGWWGDLGEPEVHPDWVQHEIGSAREVHNIYGHQWAKMVFEGFQQSFPERRAFNLMRAGYAGSQRYGMIPWTGDVSRNWGGLKPQPEIALQMGMQGLAYIHSDLGGFAWPNEDPELYTRWMQYGVFQPVYRPHAQDDVPSEPVFWDEETLRLTREAIELRYRLMPYIYTAAFQNSQTGLPFMRPLFFEEPDNFRFYHIAESYLFGDDILVAPVLRQGEKEVTVHMPNTANWHDFHTGRSYRGGKAHTVKTNKDRIPVFVRGGAVIPFADLVQSLDDYNVSHLTLRYFHDAAAGNYETMIYHDDGETTGTYEEGRFEKLHITRNGEFNTSSFQFERETGEEFEEAFSGISFEVYHAKQAPRAVLLDGIRIGFEYDESAETVIVDTFYLREDSHELTIRF